MAYGSVLTDVVQSSVTGSPAVFKDGAGTETGTLCRAWIAYNGSTQAILGSFNVSSVTRVSAGIYTITFTNALSSANYSIAMGAQSSGAAYTYGYVYNTGTPITTTYFQLAQGSAGVANYDTAYISAAVFR